MRFSCSSGSTERYFDFPIGDCEELGDLCWERDSFVSKAGGGLTRGTPGVVLPGGVDGLSLAWMPLLPW